MGGIILVVLIFFLLRWCNRRFGLLGKVVNVLKAKLFYSVMIRYVVVGYVKLTNQYLAAIFMGMIHESGIGSIVGAIIPVLILMLWPPFSALFLVKNHEQVEKKDFIAKFGAMYAGIRSDFTSLCYNAVWSVRRFDIILMN